MVDGPQLGAGGGIVADAFGQDVTGASQRGGGIRPAFFRADIFGGLGQGIDGGLTGEQEIRQRLQPLFLGNGRPGAPLGTVGLEDVLKQRQRIGAGDGFFEFVGQQIAFGERFKNGFAPLIEFRQTEQAFANGGDGHLVKGAGGFLAIAGNEGHGGAFGK